jgi:hypothetical protein
MARRFITWPDPWDVVAEINFWWRKNSEIGKPSILCTHSLGKAQRIAALVDAGIGSIFTHGAVEHVMVAYRTICWNATARTCATGSWPSGYSGLTDGEIREVDRFIRSNTLERFGPVRAVKPGLVFEIAFEDIRRSARHRSGVDVRFPRIARRRSDKAAAEADTLETVQALLASAGSAKRN